MLLLVDFGGPLAARLQAQAALAITGGLLVCLGTLASQRAWLAAVAMAVVAFAVIFAGVVSSVLAGATTALLLAFILPVSLAAPVSSVPARLAGWGLASAAALAAVALLWPAPARDPLRGAARAACRALASPAALGGRLPGQRRRPAARCRSRSGGRACGRGDQRAAPHLPGHPVPPDRTQHIGAGHRAPGGRDELAGYRYHRFLAARPAASRQPGGLRGQGGRSRGPGARRGPARASRAAAAVPSAPRRPGWPSRWPGWTTAPWLTCRSSASPPAATGPSAVTEPGGEFITLARPGLPRPGGRLRRLAHRPQHRADRGRRAAQLACRGCSAVSPPGCQGRYPRRSSGRRRTSSRTRSGCTTACAARSGWDWPC